MTNRSPARLVGLLAALLALLATSLVAAAPAQAQPATVTNTAHLDFLLDQVTPRDTPAHTTYRMAQEPRLVMPWTYADSRPGGAFARVGGGPLDPSTGHYGQGAFNADDIARAAVVYLRHWQQFDDRASRTKAYELLRSITYLQTAVGANSGHVVLWTQADGTLNPSPQPVELPDPSDSGPSYWQARTMWALGEGYAAFASDDPAFAAFLQERLRLSLKAVRHDVLTRYGQYRQVDGRRVPAWLIVDGADATAEATLGLAAYVCAAPGDRAARRALRELLEGVADMATHRTSWPYGAILPWAKSRSMWHAWSSQPAAALSRGSLALDQPGLLRPAVTEAVSFDTTLITAGGPDNAWYPTPVDRTQIAYGIDSRVQDLLTTADAAQLPGLRSLAAMDAAWFFGANRVGTPIYDPATGVTFDGLAADGTVNHNSGAESTIHGLLTMLALDAHPAVRAQAMSWRQTPDRRGLVSVEAESAGSMSGSVITPASAWTGESQYGGGAFLRLSSRQTARLAIGSADQARTVEPVSWLTERGSATSRWSDGSRNLGTLRARVGVQGISAVPGALLPQPLAHRVKAGSLAVTVRDTRGRVDLDALLLRPVIGRASFGTGTARTQLLTSLSSSRAAVSTGFATPSTATRYDSSGRLVGRTGLTRVDRAWVEPGGFTVVTAGWS